MKKILFLLALSFLTITAIQAQKNYKWKYHTSGGVLGALNFSEFKTWGSNASNVDYDTKTGWGAGFWVNFPLGKKQVFSFEPQLQYNSYNYFAPYVLPLLLNKGNINYFSIPLQLKLNLGHNFAVGIGPQLDITTSVTDKQGSAKKEDFNNLSFNLFGGFELFPHGPVTVFARYIHGFSDMENRTNPVPRMVEYENRNLQAGIKVRLFGKPTKIMLDTDGDGITDDKDKCPTVPGVAKYDGCPIPDTDGDGINDDEDKCPTVPGLRKYQGCPIPDTDKDGINDEEDKCPTVPGIAKYQGCPIPDTDGDGINDEEDKCPTVPGLRKYQGCPPPDRDGDGVIDDEDRCPDTPGIKENYGCPEITEEVKKKLEYAGKNVYFNTASTKLLSKSFAPLNEVVKIMNENMNLHLKIDGHTDSQGSDEYNLKLSDGRAASVKAYLVEKGISEDRLASEGFGESKPIADNKTSAGRAKNRRVEMTPHY
ncbi:MAG: OmpA family protein [Chitinophagaceae bacterium]